MPSDLQYSFERSCSRHSNTEVSAQEGSSTAEDVLLHEVAVFDVQVLPPNLQLQLACGHDLLVGKLQENLVREQAMIDRDSKSLDLQNKRKEYYIWLFSLQSSCNLKNKQIVKYFVLHNFAVVH